LKLRFGKKELRDIRVRAMIAHPLWEEYLIAKSVELANGLTAKKTVQRRKQSTTENAARIAGNA
jgi:hypothetical protein